MNKFDGRLLSEESLELLRSQAHRLREQGHTWAQIASIVGVHLSTVMSWSRRFALGTAAVGEVASARRGRRLGEGRTLSLADEAGLREWIVSSPPSALGLPYALWSRRAVQQAIKVKFDIDMPIRTVGEYLRRWGLRAAAPGQAGAGAAPGAGAPVVAGGLPGHRPACQGRAGAGALGRRDGRTPRHRLGARLARPPATRRWWSMLPGAPRQASP